MNAVLTSPRAFFVNTLGVFYYGGKQIDGVHRYNKDSVIRALGNEQLINAIDDGEVYGEINQIGKESDKVEDFQEHRVCFKILNLLWRDDLVSDSIIVSGLVEVLPGPFYQRLVHELDTGVFRGAYRANIAKEGEITYLKTLVTFDRWGRLNEPSFSSDVKTKPVLPAEVVFIPFDKKLRPRTDKSVTLTTFDHTITDIPVLEKMYEKGCMIAMIGRTVVAAGNGQFRLMGRLSRGVEPDVMRLPVLTLTNIIESLTDMSEYEIDLTILRKLLEAGADVPDMSTIPNAIWGNLVYVRPRYMGAVVKLFSFITHDGVQIEN